MVFPKYGSPRAAFEVIKGPQRILVLNETQVTQLLDPNELLDGLELGFSALAQGEVQSPSRPEITVPGNLQASMGWIPRYSSGIASSQSVRHDRCDRGLQFP